MGKERVKENFHICQNKLYEIKPKREFQIQYIRQNTECSIGLL